MYDLPDSPPPIAVAAAGPKAATVAGRIGDALISTAPDHAVVETFEKAGGTGKPRYGQLHVCWAESDDKARRIALDHWPNAAIPGELGQELPLPAHFEQVAGLVTEEEVAKAIVCGPDPKRHLDRIREYVDAGFDHVYVHQVGPEQTGFFRFYEREILPAL